MTMLTTGGSTGALPDPKKTASMTLATMNTGGMRPMTAPNTTGAGGTGGQVAPGVGQSAYTANSNLVGTQFTPQDSARLQGMGGMVDTAAQGVSNFQFTPFQSQGPFTSSGTQQYQNIQDTQGRTSGETSMAGAMPYMTAAGQSGTAGTAGMNALMGMASDGGGGGGGFSYGGPGADVGDARALTMKALESSMTGPDRTKLAQDAFDLMKDSSQTDFEQSQRQVGQKAAALGRVGAGMTTNDLTGLAQSRDNSLNYASRDLALQAADKTLADNIARTDLGARTAMVFADSDRGDAGLNLAGAQLGEQSAARVAGNKLGAANSLMGYDISDRSLKQGVGNDLFGMGATNTRERAADADRLTGTDQFNTGLNERKSNFQYGADIDAYDRATNERNTSRADEYNQEGAGLRKLDSLSGLEGRQQTQERNNRTEMRGERDFQTGRSDRAQNNAIEQQKFNEWLRNSGWNRTMGAANQGFGGGPTSAYQNAANGR